MRSLFLLGGLMLFSISLFSQLNNIHHAGIKNDLRYRNGRNHGGMGVFTVIGGVGCMLAPGVQFNSSIGGSTSDVLFMTAGVVLIVVGIRMLTSNARNRGNTSRSIPILKYEPINNAISNTKMFFPAIGLTIPIN